MRIALIAGTYRPEHCGVADYTARLRQHLKQRGIESIVLTTYSKAIAPTDNNEIQEVIEQWNLKCILPLIQAIHASKADLLHIQHAAGTYGFDRSIFLLPLLLRLTGWRAPIVTTVHEYGWWEWQPKGIPPRWLEWLKTWGQQQGWWDREDGFLLTQSAAIITTNAGAEATIQARLPHLQSRLHRIPIGANVEVSPLNGQTRQQLRQRYGWSNDAQVIAFFGFLHPVKGLENLLSAFQIVLAKCPLARLLLIGGVESLALPSEQASSYWQRLEYKVAELNLNSCVYMTGYMDADAISQSLAGVDIGVLPFNHGVTLKSGSLLTLMAHALPIVATCANPAEIGLEKVVQIVPPRSIVSLADEITNLLQDANLRQRLGAAAYQFSRQFNWINIADAHLSIYQSIL
jgi:polysaccharide biosynthesis protein PslF